MSDDVVARQMAPVAYGEHAAFSWALRRLTEGQTFERQRDLLVEALSEVLAVTGQVGLGTLLLFVEHARSVGEGEDGR